ncbi:MAG: phosphorylase [Bacteroidetes bacterium RIFCSPLOWO2_12_FULL_35_15]|nr:MAG: phosphorylase [Bacteroidetes bacterium RIFCSPLOWO2_12_FULL_35_15]
MNTPIPETELILNGNGSVYHLQLLPEHIAENIIIVGDQGRVETVSNYFDTVDFKVQNREFVTHTGTFNGKRVMVVSSGIGTDNIDILINELDAAVNIDLTTRIIKKEHKKLNIVRIGTSGALQKDILVDSFVVSSHGLGFDGLLNYYLNMPFVNEDEISEGFIEQTNWNKNLPYPYAVKGSEMLINKIGFDLIKGITATAPGFYGPQGRKLRLTPWVEDFNQQLTDFKFKENRITNFEMETSALYGLGKLLGHETCTVCAIIANRVAKQYSKNYHVAVEKLIQLVLERLTK